MLSFFSEFFSSTSVDYLNNFASLFLNLKKKRCLSKGLVLLERQYFLLFICVGYFTPQAMLCTALMAILNSTWCCLVTKSSGSLATLWTVACQDPLPMGFPRQEYYSRLPFVSPGIFPIQGSNPCLLHCGANSLPLSHQGNPWIVLYN